MFSDLGPVLVILALAAIALLVMQLLEASRRLPRYPHSFHCDTCGIRLSSDDQAFRDQVLGEHVAKGHDAGEGWVV